MAQLWSTGGALVYAAPWAASPGSASFVGTCTDKPRLDVEFEWEPVQNDLAGRRPMDRMYGGKGAQISLDLDRFNYPVVQALCSPPNFSAALAGLAGLAGFPGVDQPGDVGSLMFTEGMAYQLYVVFPYASKAAMGALAPTGMVPGYHFFGCLTNNESIVSGTTPHRKLLVVDAERVFYPGVSNAFGYGQFVLYDYNVSGLPAPN